MELGDLVKVVWLDAHGSAANVTYSLDEIPHAPIQCQSYGILLRQDDIGVSIASEICDDGIFRGYSFVPAGMLVRVESPVKPKRKRKPKVPVVTIDTETEKAPQE